MTIIFLIIKITIQKIRSAVNFYVLYKHLIFRLKRKKINHSLDNENIGESQTCIANKKLIIRLRNIHNYLSFVRIRYKKKKQIIKKEKIKI